MRAVGRGSWTRYCLPSGIVNAATRLGTLKGGEGAGHALGARVPDGDPQDPHRLSLLRGLVRDQGGAAAGTRRPGRSPRDAGPAGAEPRPLPPPSAPPAPRPPPPAPAPPPPAGPRARTAARPGSTPARRAPRSHAAIGSPTVERGRRDAARGSGSWHRGDPRRPPCGEWD